MTDKQMSVLTDLEVPAEEFVMADTITAVPEMRIEIKRVVADQSSVTPYFWAAGGDFEAFERAMAADPTINDVMVLEQTLEALEDTTERFYRVTWSLDVPNLITAVSHGDGTILEAVTDGATRWKVTLLFPNETSLSSFHEYCQEHDFSYVAERIYRPSNGQPQGEYDLTMAQLEALEGAFNSGYFEVPRGHNLTEIAAQLDISRNALSNRLRRGLHNLIANTIIHDE